MTSKNDDPFGLLGGVSLSTIYENVALNLRLSEIASRQHIEQKSELCNHCGGQMRCGMNTVEYICNDCGAITEGDEYNDDAPRKEAPNIQLRIVGPGSNQLQPDLYSSGTGSIAANRGKQIFEEFLAYRQKYIEYCGKASITIDACKKASEYYVSIPNVKRSHCKKEIMGACLYNACFHIGFAPTKADIATMMQLQNKGIARGDNFVRSLIADGKMEIDTTDDHKTVEISTLFANLSLDGDKYKILYDAVDEIVQIAEKNLIGHSSLLRSKVFAATYEVMRRCNDKALIDKAPTLQEFCDKWHIRRNTIERFIKELYDFHSYFENCYKKYNLRSERKLKDFK